MNLAETLFQRLGEWRPTGDERPATAIDLAEHGWAVHLSANRVDTLGIVLTKAEAVRSTPVADDAAAIGAHARKAASRVTGLLEPLRLIEVDRTRNIAILRSDAPRTRNKKALYYEVRYTGLNRVSVERFAASKESPAHRESVEFTLTHEVLAKLVEDLVAD